MCATSEPPPGGCPHPCGVGSEVVHTGHGSKPDMARRLLRPHFLLHALGNHAVISVRGEGATSARIPRPRRSWSTDARRSPFHFFCVRAIVSSKLAVSSLSVIPSATHHSRTSIKSSRRCPLSHLLTNGWSTLSLAARSLCKRPADSLAARRVARKRPYCCVYMDFSTVGPSWHEVNSLQSKSAYAKIAYAMFAYFNFA